MIQRRLPRSKSARKSKASDKSNGKPAKDLIVLLQEWLSDESGYDEATWPTLRKALDLERKRQGARRLFNG